MAENQAKRTYSIPKYFSKIRSTQQHHKFRTA